MITSDQIDQLATALAAAQAVIEGADKGNTNPHFKSKYADLASVWDACRKPLTDNGLSVVQALGSNGDSVTCTTMLLHKSGQYIRSVFEMTPAQKTPQAAGSCATYLRRYSLQAIVGVAPEDDDGNEASSKGPQKCVVQNPVVKKTTQVKSDVAAPSASQIVMFDETNDGHAKAVALWCEQKKCKDTYRSMISAMKGQPFTRAGFDAAWEKVNPEAPDKEPETKLGGK